MSQSLLPEHGALHGGAVVGQGQRRPALPAGARRRQVPEEEVRHTLGELGLLLKSECDTLCQCLRILVTAAIYGYGIKPLV